LREVSVLTKTTICLTLVATSFLAGAIANRDPSRFRLIRTIAGSGQTGEMRLQGRASNFVLSNPFGIQEEEDGSLIIASFDQHAIYRLDPSYTTLRVIAGTGNAGIAGTGGQPATQVMLNAPHEVQVDQAGNIYVADTNNHRVGVIEAGTGRWRVLAGTGQSGFSGDSGPASEARLNQAYSIALDGERLLIADLGNHRIRAVDLRSGIINTICGTGEKKLPVNGGAAREQSLAGPRSLAVDDRNIWIVLREGNSVWRIDRTTNRIFHVAGSGEKGFSGDGGDALKATFNGPKGIVVSPGFAVYIADTENHAVRAINLASGNIQTIVGSPTGRGGFSGDGNALQMRLLSRPHGLCLLRSGELAIGDSENHRVRLLVP
jgi:sugar lactone lactonase YvrE